MSMSDFILRFTLIACLVLSSPITSPAAQDLSEEEIEAVTDWLVQGRNAYIKIYDAYFNLRSANAALNEYYLDERTVEQALNSYDFRRRNFEQVLESAYRQVNRMPAPPAVSDTALSDGLEKYLSFLTSTVEGVDAAGALVTQMREAVAAQDKDTFTDLTAQSFTGFLSVMGSEDMLTDMSLMAVSADQPQYAVIQAIRHNNRAIGELMSAASAVYGREIDGASPRLAAITEAVSEHLVQARAFIQSGEAVNDQELDAVRGQRRLVRQIANSIHESYETSFQTERGIADALDLASQELASLDQAGTVDMEAMFRRMAEFNVQLQPLMDERMDARGNRQTVMGQMR